MPFRGRSLVLTAPMRATTVREWFPTKGQRHAVKALVLGPAGLVPLRNPSLTLVPVPRMFPRGQATSITVL